MTLAIQPSLESILGPASTRYFGNGYLSVTRTASPLQPTADPRLFTGTVHLHYPRNWSTKSATGTLVPHLSSVDTLLVAAGAASAAVRGVSGLDDTDPSRFRVADVTMIAGTSPIEDLSAIPLTLAVGSSIEETGTWATTVKYTLASMRGTVRLTHPRPQVTPVRSGPLAMGIDTPIECRMHIDDIRVGPDHVLGIAHMPTGTPTPTLADGLVGAAQLAQVLLYQLDNMDRDSSNTLWMRRLALSTTEIGETRQHFPARLRLRRSSILQMNGDSWRSADLELTDFAGITVRCLAAHQLPATPTP